MFLYTCSTYVWLRRACPPQGGLVAAAARRSGLHGKSWNTCNTPVMFSVGNTLTASQPLSEANEAYGRAARTYPPPNLNESRLCESMLYRMCACPCVVCVCVCRVPTSMCRLPFTCRKLPPSISNRRPSKIMQRRGHVHEGPVRVAELPSTCVRWCLRFRRLPPPPPFSPLATQWSSGGNNTCHIAHRRIRNMCNRIYNCSHVGQ